MAGWRERKKKGGGWCPKGGNIYECQNTLLPRLLALPPTLGFATPGNPFLVKTKTTKKN
jgi:hypothetical protein